MVRRSRRPSTASSAPSSTAKIQSNHTSNETTPERQDCNSDLPSNLQDDRHCDKKITTEWWNVDTAIFDSLTSQLDGVGTSVFGPRHDDTMAPTFGGNDVKIATLLDTGQEESKDNSAKNTEENDIDMQVRRESNKSSSFSLALTYKAFKKYSQFPIAAFSMLPIASRIEIVSPVTWWVQSVELMLRTLIVKSLVRGEEASSTEFGDVRGGDRAGRSREEEDDSIGEPLVAQLAVPLEIADSGILKTGMHCWTTVKRDTSRQRPDVLLWLSEEKSNLVNFANSLTSSLKYCFERNVGEEDERSGKASQILARKVFRSFASRARSCLDTVMRRDSLSGLMKCGRQLMLVQKDARLDDSRLLYIPRSHTMQRLRQQERFSDIATALENRSDLILNENNLLLENLKDIHRTAVK